MSREAEQAPGGGHRPLGLTAAEEATSQAGGLPVGPERAAAGPHRRANWGRQGPCCLGHGDDGWEQGPL